MNAATRNSPRQPRRMPRSNVLKLWKRMVLTIRSAGTISITMPSHAIGLACKPSREIKHRCRDEAGGGRAGQADEVALVGVPLDVETREAQRRGREVHEANGPTHAAERNQSPLERQHRRRHAERDQIGERIELHAEFARGPGHARDAAVEHVEHDGEADERRRCRDVAAHRVDDAGPAAEQVRKREQAGQQRHAAPDPAAIVPA